MAIPAAWYSLPMAGFRGLLMLLGAPDTGKSTLARYLYGRLSAEGRRVAFLDGDPGQGTLGPPATLTLALGRAGDDTFPPAGPIRHRFVGATSPRGHMLPMVVGAARLVGAAREAGSETIVHDTTGLVEPAQGGLSLKLAKIELLRPAAVIAIQRTDELEPLLVPLRRSRGLSLFELRPSPAARPRDLTTRQAYRAAQFARYFAGARSWVVDFAHLAVIPAPDFVFSQLVALEDADGFLLSLGIVQRADLSARRVNLLTPLASPETANALRLGDLIVDPRTFRDQRIEM